MKKTFLTYDKPLLMAMVQEETPEDCINIITDALWDGAEAFGIQLEDLRLEYRNPETLRGIFACCEDKPIYVTSYRKSNSKGFTDEQCAELLLMAAKCGATLCDVMGDMFHPEPHELTMDETAIQKQKELINAIHAIGSEVLMSTHIRQFYGEAEVLKIAEEQVRRGTDIIKIVNHAETEDQLFENIQIIHSLKKRFDKNFLYLANGQYNRLLREIGPKLGVCMYLCVHSYRTLNFREQPKLRNMKILREIML